MWSVHRKHYIILISYSEMKVNLLILMSFLGDGEPRLTALLSATVLAAWVRVAPVAVSDGHA